MSFLIGVKASLLLFCQIHEFKWHQFLKTCRKCPLQREKNNENFSLGPGEVSVCP